MKMRSSFKTTVHVAARTVTFVATIFISAICGANASCARERNLEGSQPVFPLPHSEFYAAMRSIAQSNKLRLGAQTPTPCGASKNNPEMMHLCEYEVFRVRVGVWSIGPQDPVMLVSARPFFHASQNDLVLALSLIISTIEEDMSNAAVQNAAERLVSVSRSLDGTSTFEGKNAHFAARLSKGGFIFLASGQVPSEP